MTDISKKDIDQSELLKNQREPKSKSERRLYENKKKRYKLDTKNIALFVQFLMASNFRNT